MNKAIKLLTKKVRASLALGLPEQDFDLTSQSFILIALQGYAENLKGIERMLRIAGLIAKLKETDGQDTWILEDADYLTVKDSVDKFQGWGPLILHFPEFLDSIANPEKVKPEQKETSGGK